MDEKQEQRRKRLKFLMSTLKIKNVDLAKAIGSSPAFVSQLLNGHREITTGFAHRVIERYPSVNAMWLVNGEGGMFLLGEIGKSDISQYPFFGTNISELRSSNNLSHEGLATRLELAVNSLTELEEGRLQPSLDVVAKAWRVFGVPMEVLLFEDITLDQMKEVRENATLYLKQQEQIEKLMNMIEMMSEKVEKVVDRVEQLEKEKNK